MGGGNFDSDSYTSKLAYTKSTGKDFFGYDADIKSGKVEAKVHELLDPSRKNKAGKNVRESFDSPEHPNSRPIVVGFDETGSMKNTPYTFKEKLPSLMDIVTKKRYVEDPQILFAGIGDATSDDVPLQIGQFESSNVMGDFLSNIYLEGNGGSQKTESYQNFWYYLARHTDLDSVKKRGVKGYLFVIGDEKPYQVVDKDEIKQLIGDKLDEDILTSKILDEVREKFEVFWIIPAKTTNSRDEKINKYLTDTFGQNLLRLDNAEDVCELIVTTIGLNEGFSIKKIEQDLKDNGANVGSIQRASESAKAIGRKFSFD